MPPVDAITDREAEVFEPVAVEARYPLPHDSIDPDRNAGWLRRLMPVIGHHRRTVAWSLCLAVVALTTQVAVPYLTGRAIDDAIRTRSSSLWPWVVTLIVLGIGRGGFTYAYRYGLYSMAYRIDFELRSLMYDHFTRLSFGFYDRMQSGQLISRANADIKSVQMYLALAPMLATSLVGFAVAVAVMVWISVPLTLVSIVALPVVYVCGVAMRNRMFPLSWIIQSRAAEISTIVEENVTGTRVVKSFAAEERQIEMMAGAARRLRWANVVQGDARAKWSPAMENLPRVSMVGVLLYGGWLVTQDRLGVGSIVTFNSYIIVLQIPFRLLGFFLMLGQRARASAERIFEILDTRPDVDEQPGAVSLERVAGTVDFDDVTFAYGSTPSTLDSGVAPTAPRVLAGFDLRVPSGQTIAIVGRTGCGKSTVARLLARFYDIEDGTIRIDGVDITEATLPSLRHAVGLVLDEPFLFSASIRDNIAYARPDASLADVEHAARNAEATEFIDDLPDGFDTVIGERGYTLSGGQRQRIAIARTLLADPPILVLDDATSAIDVEVEERIHRAMRTVMEGRTTIVIAHRLSTIALAERVVLMENGTIVADGTHRELMANEPRYAEVLAHSDDGARPGGGS